MFDEQPEAQDSPAPKVIDAPLHIWCDVLYVRADDVARQVAEALKKEREACAKACEAEQVAQDIRPRQHCEGDQTYNTALGHAAQAIRLRSNVEVSG